MVEPAQEFEPAVRRPAHAVAGPVQPSPGRREGIGYEALGGEVRPAEIAAREPGAADRELPRHPGGDEIERAVEHVDRGAVDRAADRRRQAVSRHRHGSPRRHHAALRRAVVVHQGEGERTARHPQQPVAAGQQGAQGELRRQGVRRQIEELLGERRRQEAEGNPLGRQPGEELRGEEPGLLVRDVQRGPRCEVGPDLPDRGVEAGRGDQGRAIPFADTVGAQVPARQVRQPGTGDLDSFGTTGRARGVDDVGPGFGRDRC